MINYLNKFNLNNKIAYVVGGLGLIGKEVSIAFASAGAETIVLDVNNNEAKKISLAKGSISSNSLKPYELFLNLVNIT